MAKSPVDQSTSSVNCIATNGTSSNTPVTSATMKKEPGSVELFKTLLPR